MHNIASKLFCKALLEWTDAAAAGRRPALLAEALILRPALTPTSPRRSGPRAQLADYIRESLAESTRTAYLSDLTHFERWGGQIPASPETIAKYLVAHADVLSTNAGTLCDALVFVRINGSVRAGGLGS